MHSRQAAAHYFHHYATRAHRKVWDKVGAFFIIGVLGTELRYADHK